MLFIMEAVCPPVAKCCKHQPMGACHKPGRTLFPGSSVTQEQIAFKNSIVQAGIKYLFIAIEHDGD